jgi:hypothetical protein
LQAVPISLWTKLATGEEEVFRLPLDEIARLTSTSD